MSPSGNIFRHDYLVVDGEVFSFQAGSNPIWSDGRIDKEENRNNSQCEVVSKDSEFDEAVKKAIGSIGEPKYNIWAYPMTTSHLFGARNCQTWVNDIIKTASESLKTP